MMTKILLQAEPGPVVAGSGSSTRLLPSSKHGAGVQGSVLSDKQPLVGQAGTGTHWGLHTSATAGIPQLNPNLSLFPGTFSLPLFSHCFQTRGPLTMDSNSL